MSCSASWEDEKIQQSGQNEMRLFFQTIFLAAMVVYTSSTAIANTEKPAWLFVQTASGYEVEGSSLTMPYEREIFAFTDRPNRQYRYLNAHEFTALWSGGDDDFSQDPPNAVLTWVSDGEVQEAEIELMGADLGQQGRAIIYRVQLEGGQMLPSSAEQVSMFVDGLVQQDRFLVRGYSQPK